MKIKLQKAKRLQEVTWDFSHIAWDSLMEVKCLLARDRPYPDATRKNQPESTAAVVSLKGKPNLWPLAPPM